MDGENNGKPYESMDDLGGFHPPLKETPKCLMNEMFGKLGRRTGPNGIRKSLRSL